MNVKTEKLRRLQIIFVIISLACLLVGVLGILSAGVLYICLGGRLE